MVLSMVEGEKIVKIRGLNGGRRFVERLNSMGIHVGMRIKVVRRAPFGGPVLIEGVDSPVRVMIGYGMAQKIEVEAV